MARNRLSILAIVLAFSAIAGYRLHTFTEPQITWDVFGYYLYLPATFIHGDPLLNDVAWVEDAWKNYDTSTSMFYLLGGPKPGLNYFYMMGMAVLYLPWFFLGHMSAAITGHPMDGYSDPYQWSMILGFLFYTLIALVNLRRILLRFFSDSWVAYLICLIALGTNIFYFTTISSLETGLALFFLFTFVVWHTIRWYEEKRPRDLYVTALACGLMVLCKPSEIFCLLIPLLWGLRSFRELFRVRLPQMWKERAVHLKASGLAISLFVPQMVYWTIRTGSPIYDSYRNAGVGLDLLSPHTIDALFSFKKGWLIYTPIMWFALFGFIQLYRKKRELFFPILTYFLISLWIITSWTEWWYAGGFSIRPMMTSYVLLAIPMGYLFMKLWKTNILGRITTVLVPLCFVVLNLFQTWQFLVWILHSDAVTMEYYFTVFGKTSVTPEDRESMAWIRTFEPDQTFAFYEDYDCRIQDEFSDENGTITGHIGGGNVYGKARKFRYEMITDQSHAWVNWSMMVKPDPDYAGRPIHMVTAMTRRGGSYGYSANTLNDLQPGEWRKIEHSYQTPIIRSSRDEVEIYIYGEDGPKVQYKDLKIEVCVRSDGK